MNPQDHLNAILRLIPSGAQTLSKYPTQFVVGVTPPAVTRGEGAYLWDIEDKKYLDMILALGAIVFGYNDKRIDAAVARQMAKGAIFSLPADIELNLAKLITEVVPCAQMCRFYLNGNDATSGAVRLARHVTGREHVAKCGYHGWQDWSVANKAGRNTGVPAIVKTLTHDFTYNDIASLEKIFSDFPEQIAAVIMEPANTEKPTDNFLQKVKDVAHKHGTVFIFDEMITGFRWALGGAQEYFGVVPDIACFGKAISNGYPISVVCGQENIMKRMDEIFVSTTFGGSTLGVAAAIEAIAMMREYGDVHQHMHALGDYLIEEANRVFQKHGLSMQYIGYGPHPALKVSISDDLEARIVKTFLFQEMNKAGILVAAALMVGYCHTKEHIDQFLSVLERTCAQLAECKPYSAAEKFLEGKIMAPRSVRAGQ